MDEGDGAEFHYLALHHLGRPSLRFSKSSRRTVLITTKLKEKVPPISVKKKKFTGKLRWVTKFSPSGLT